MSCGREEIVNSISDTSSPSIPTGLTVDNAFDGQVGLSWDYNYEQEVLGYKIYRSIGNENNFQFIQLTSYNYFDDSGLYYDSLYYYEISAIDSNNNESEKSLPVSAKPVNIYAPLPPSLVNINARNQNGVKSIFISWSPSPDKDIAFYRVYRDTVEFGNTGDAKKLAEIVGTTFTDQNDIQLFQNYFYRIAAVDQGDLQSTFSYSVNDYILDTPILLYPDNTAIVTNLSDFQIKTVGKPATYKLVIQDNPAFGPLKEINFDSDRIHTEISINTGGLQLDGYKTYFWRVLTYTNNNKEPNSFSDLYSFLYNPE